MPALGGGLTAVPGPHLCRVAPVRNLTRLWTPVPFTPTVMGMWSRRTFPFIFWGLWAATVIGRSGALLLIAALVTVSYIVSLVVHPRARCLRCDGTGELKGSVYGGAHRRCPDCQGGRIIRWGGAPVRAGSRAGAGAGEPAARRSDPQARAVVNGPHPARSGDARREGHSGTGLGSL